MINENYPLISISILTYNRVKLLRTLLVDLTSLQYTYLEIIVIDNHSQDETQQAIPVEFPSVKYIRTDKNIGASARNIGMQAAVGDIIVTLDDDIQGLNDKDLRFLANYFDLNPKVGALNFGVRTIEGEVCNWVHHCKQEEFYDKNFMTYEITEGAVAFRKMAISQSGGYSDAFFLSHEGPDLAFRIYEAGYEVRYSGVISVSHHFANEGRTPWRNYYFDTRNQIWLAARNFPISYAITYLVRGLPAMAFYSIRDGFFLYWVKALWDGIIGLRSSLKERRALSKETMSIILDIDSQRPNILYVLKRRFRRSIMLK